MCDQCNQNNKQLCGRTTCSFNIHSSKLSTALMYKGAGLSLIHSILTKNIFGIKYTQLYL